MRPFCWIRPADHEPGRPTVRKDSRKAQADGVRAQGGLSMLSSRAPSPNLWADVWLAASAISLDCEFTTFDRGFKSLRGLKLRLPEMPDR